MDIFEDLTYGVGDRVEITMQDYKTFSGTINFVHPRYLILDYLGYPLEDIKEIEYV